MRRLSAFAVVFTICSTLAACSSSEHDTAKPGAVTFEGQRDPSPKAKLEGGQPGVIDLRGSVVKISGQPTDSLKVKLEAGVNLVNERAPLARETRFSPLLTSADKAEIETTRELDTTMRNRCLSHLGETIRLKTDKTRSWEKNAVWKAKVIVICNGFDFSSFETLRIVAEKVILDDAVFEIVGTKTSRLEIVADTLALFNRSSITTKGADNLTEFGAPGLSIVANHVSGLGSLHIKASGGDRRRAEEGPVAQLVLPGGP